MAFWENKGLILVFLGGPMVQTPHPLLGVQVPSLVNELRSHKPQTKCEEKF